MNVLIICTEKLPVPPVKGGAIQTYIAGAIPTLSKEHTVTILGTTDPSLPDEETVDNVHYVRKPGGLLETYREEVIEYLKTENCYDLIHIFNRPRLVTAVRELAPEAKIILSMHNDMFKPEKISHDEGLLVIKNVDKIVTISDYIGQTITNFFPEVAPKLRTIYSGVDLDNFVPSYSESAIAKREQLRKEYNLGSKKIILFAGRLSLNKGAHILLRAIPELSKKYSDIAVVLMGGKWFSDDGISDYTAYVRSLADCSPVPVIATGFISPDKIQDWFAAADIFVCTSQWQEPLARVHYEAMAAGLPIITTNRGGNAEVIELNKNGLIVEKPDEPLEFAKHLSYLIENPDICLEMGRYGRKLAEAKYSWDRVVNDILTVWNEVENMSINNNPQIEDMLGDELDELNMGELGLELVNLNNELEPELDNSGGELQEEMEVQGEGQHEGEETVTEEEEHGEEETVTEEEEHEGEETVTEEEEHEGEETVTEEEEHEGEETVSEEKEHEGEETVSEEKEHEGEETVSEEKEHEGEETAPEEEELGEDLASPTLENVNTDAIEDDLLEKEKILLKTKKKGKKEKKKREEKIKSKSKKKLKNKKKKKPFVTEEQKEHVEIVEENEQNQIEGYEGSVEINITEVDDNNQNEIKKDILISFRGQRRYFTRSDWEKQRKDPL
ncbi:glycosyltransferase family 4 protein [Bacillus sp. FJAT-45350]|uniref:glycosyltransferase family 4 protein n=1 Tax=Bacillus sp. FJAT-45350 TaxID=2011014 RepID=UPI000BB68B4A|nr:glycosyltransferase family 4 protein [Bacillus sp. FJAT-45350]